MKNVLKIFYIMCLFILGSFSVMALDESNTLCTYTDTATNLTFNSMLNYTPQDFTAFGTDEGMGGVNWIYPTTDWPLEQNETINATAGSLTLDWDYVDDGSLVVYNSSYIVPLTTETLLATAANATNATGNWLNTTLITDGDMSTGSGLNLTAGNGNAELLLNYTTTVPCIGNTSSYITTLYDSTVLNITLPANCSEMRPVQLMVNVTNSTGVNNTKYHCNDSDSWVEIANVTADLFYDINITWDYETYSVAYATGVVTWEDNCFIDNNLNMVYNRTFLANGTNSDLSTYTSDATVNGTDDWSETYSWYVTNFDLNDTNWTVNYDLTSRVCTARDSCLGTRATVFAGFALLAVLAIVLSAFGIIKVFETGDMTIISTALVVGVIGLGIILIMGYYIVGIVAQSICAV